MMFITHYKETRLLHAQKIREIHRQAVPTTSAYTGTNSTTPSNESKTAVLDEEAITQEVYYNLGRALAHAGLNNLAVDHYYQALEIQDDYDILYNQPSADSSSRKILPLTRQAAFNLVLILKRSRSTDLAYEVMSKYLAIE